MLLYMNMYFAKMAQTIRLNNQVNKSCLGLLNWATSISHHLKSHTPLCTQTSTAHRPLFTTSLCGCGNVSSPAYIDNGAVVTSIPVSARIIEVGSLRVCRKSDVPLLPKSDRPTWVRVADPTASEIALTKDSRESLASLLSCVHSTPTKPLSDPRLLRCLSAADAMAEGDTVGIGGWLCTKDGLHWFSEVWSMSEVRDVWPQLHKDEQRYIACFETLARLAFLRMAHSRLGHKYLSLCQRAQTTLPRKQE